MILFSEDCVAVVAATAVPYIAAHRSTINIFWPSDYYCPTLPRSPKTWFPFLGDSPLRRVRHINFRSQRPSITFSRTFQSVGVKSKLAAEALSFRNDEQQQQRGIDSARGRNTSNSRPVLFTESQIRAIVLPSCQVGFQSFERNISSRPRPAVSHTAAADATADLAEEFTRKTFSSTSDAPPLFARDRGKSYGVPTCG